MNEPAISIRNVSKRYRLGAINRRTLVDEIQYGWLKLCGKDPVAHMGKVGAKARQRNPEFWALRDVSFDVQPGEIVGIIGRNGAGKSTILKILSRITEPTTGSAVINGRVGSLLEVGTGFHPEMTGRENIFMNGTILGMKRREIEANFDEIVAFSEIEKFIDTPVKRYSSGMYVRLAFAVAAHLQPEVLFVDEVLAVGDSSFQKKCLGKMESVAKEGRTILFVSHNMAAIENLCTHAVWLEQGAVRMVGDTAKVIEHYLGDMPSADKGSSLRERKDRQGTGRARLIDFYVLNEQGKRQHVLQPGNTYRFRLVCETDTNGPPLSNVSAGISFFDSRNEIIWLVNSNFTHDLQCLRPGITELECLVHDFNVAEGIYRANLYIGVGTSELLDYVISAVEIVVEGGNFFGTGSKGTPTLCKTLTRALWNIAEASKRETGGTA